MAAKFVAHLFLQETGRLRPQAPKRLQSCRTVIKRQILKVLNR